MRQILAIARLTWKAAFRFRLFWALAGLLLISVIALPLLVKDDGTARGFTQIILTYTLSIITTLLAFSTLWLACGTLARDIEECQIQMVAVKPVARWQIWTGKWLGLMMLNAALLGLSGFSVYALMLWRAQRLPAPEQAVLRREVLVARSSIKPAYPNLADATERALREQLAKEPMSPTDQARFRKAARERVEAALSVVPPQYGRRWSIDLGIRKELLRDQPLYLRFKFFAANDRRGATYDGLWQAALPERGQVWRQPIRAPADSFQEVEIPPNLFNDQGVLTLEYYNYSDTTVLLPVTDGIEILYRAGGFGINYARGLGIIFCWLAALAALGLAAASFLSFPVAAFFSGSLLVVTLCSGTLANVVEQGTVMGEDHEGSAMPGKSGVDVVMVPAFRALLMVINLVRAFSPVDALSTGRSIPWGQLGLAVLQSVVVLGGALAVAGIILFQRRELAGAQTQA